MFGELVVGNEHHFGPTNGLRWLRQPVKHCTKCNEKDKLLGHPSYFDHKKE